jgi:hypothetical protein
MRSKWGAVAVMVGVMLGACGNPCTPPKNVCTTDAQGHEVPAGCVVWAGC